MRATLSTRESIINLQRRGGINCPAKGDSVSAVPYNFRNNIMALAPYWTFVCPRTERTL